MKDLSCSCSCNHIVLLAIDVTEGKTSKTLHIREDGAEEWKPEYLPGSKVETICLQDRGLSNYIKTGKDLWWITTKTSAPASKKELSGGFVLRLIFRITQKSKRKRKQGQDKNTMKTFRMKQDKDA